jgi:hypothetical protein
VTESGKHARKTTKLRDWSRAEDYLQHYDKGKSTTGHRCTIKELETAFLANLSNPTGKNLKEATVIKYRKSFKP